MRYFLAMLFSYFSISAISQEFAIENTRENVAYRGIPCYLRCVVNGYSSKSVSLATDNGFIKNGTELGTFVFIPETIGTANIIVSVLTSKAKKKIGNYAYRVRESPPARAMVGSSSGGNITRVQLIAMGGIVATSFPEYCTDASPLHIVSFSAKAFHNGICVFTFDNAGAMWNESIVSKLKKLNPGATLVFHNIVGRSGYGRLQKADDLTFTITDSKQ